MATDPKPSFDRTYKRADGEPFYDDWAWSISLDVLEDDDVPVELIEERWERVSVRQFWHFPTALYDCRYVVVGEPCEKDAVGWRRSPGGDWQQVCAEHQAEEGEPRDD